MKEAVVICACCGTLRAASTQDEVCGWCGLDPTKNSAARRAFIRNYKRIKSKENI